MFKKFALVFTLILAGTALLAACQRSASQAPLTSLPTATLGTVVPAAQQTAGTSSVQKTFEMIQTTTAMFSQLMTQTPVPGGAQATSTSASVGTLNPQSLTHLPGTGVPTTQGVGTPVVIVATSTPGRPTSYKLMQGEFPYCIARRFNVDPNDLLSLNGIVQGQVLQPGTVLIIPQTGVFPGIRALNPHPSTYLVTSGDTTVYSVACYYGDVDPTQIIAANSLVTPYLLHINQSLAIP